MLFYSNRATSKYMSMLLKWETRRKKKGKFVGLWLKQLQGRMKDAARSDAPPSVKMKQMMLNCFQGFQLFEQ